MCQLWLSRIVCKLNVYLDSLLPRLTGGGISTGEDILAMESILLAGASI